MTRLLILALVLTQSLFAGVVGVDITERADAAYEYERLVGTARFAVDPEAPANRYIHGLQAAPRNGDGLVEFSADIHVLRPRDSADGNGALVFEAVNRGGKGILSMFNYAGGRQPEGDGFLMRQGFTLVWVGWQFDLVDSETRMRFASPKAIGIEGWVRSAFTSNTAASEFSTAGGGHVPFEPIDVNDPFYRLIERNFSDGPGVDIPREQWRFKDSSTVTMDDGFTPGKFYEVVFRSKDPGLPGLGPAAVRDFVSYLRFENEALGGGREYDRALAFGISQSGRFLRAYLYDGYNADEQGRKVFDGVWPHIAGAARGGFTNLFGQPTHTEPFYEVDVFPFRDEKVRNPLTGVEDGILLRAAAAGVVPKIFYTNSSNEYWGRSASLLHTSFDGTQERSPSENTRIYHFAGTQHGAGSTPPVKRPGFRYALNSNDYKPFMRALLVRFDEWLKDDREPPQSQYPSVDELVSLEDMRLPKFEGSLKPGRLRRAMRLDYGPEFRSKGLAIEPPRVVGEPYAVQVLRLDADGNEIGGLHLPSVTVPLATYAGWNLVNPEILDSPEITGNTGATMPFSATKAERLATGDARLSVEERYESKARYLERIRDEAVALYKDGFVLPEDVERIVDDAARMWESVAGGN